MKKRIRRNFTLVTAWILACSLLGCNGTTTPKNKAPTSNVAMSSSSHGPQCPLLTP